MNINIGTLNERSIEAMMIAGMRAKELGHVVLLDPVGAGASFLRTKTAQSIVEEVKPDIIRGNISEIKTLAKGSGTTKGVDADAADTVTDDNLDEMVAFVKAFAEKTGAVIATGTGCQLSGMATAYAVANPDNKVDAVAAAVCLMGLAGEIGWSRMQEGDGNSTYRNRIIDAIFNIDAKTLEEGAKYEIR